MEASALAFEIRFPGEINGTTSRQVSVSQVGSTFPEFWRRKEFVNGQRVSSMIPNLAGPPGSGFASQTGWLTLEMDISDLPPLPGYSLRIFTDGRNRKPICSA